MGGRAPLNWQRLIQCESGGRNVRGAQSGYFQFDGPTWRATTGLPGQAADYDFDTQFAAAQKLYAERGRQPWPFCGRYL